MNDAEIEALEAQYKKAVYPSHVPGAHNIVFDSNLIEKGVRKLLDEVKATRLQADEMKKALASLPCKYEGTYGSPTPEHRVFSICPPCWAKKEMGLIEKPICRELVDHGHGDVFECGIPLPCTNPSHTKKRKCEFKSQAGFQCSLEPGHEGAHQVVIGYNS